MTKTMTKSEAADFFAGVARTANWSVLREASLLAAAALRRSVRSTRAAKKSAIERRKAAKSGHDIFTAPSRGEPDAEIAKAKDATECALRKR